MPILPFADWLPDIPALENPGATVATNVIPDFKSYRPVPDIAAYSTALDALCRGAFSASNSAGNTYNYAGDTAKLYEVRTAPTDRSKSGGYSTGEDEFWEFVQWGQTAIGTNFTNPVQSVTLGGAAFADLITSTLKPKARHIAVVGDFVVLGNTNDATDGDKPTRVWWSGINNSLDFQPAAATQSDNEDLSEADGWVQAIIGGVDYGVVFQERAINRMTYVGAPLVFQFDKVESSRGLLAPNAAINVGRLVYYLSDDGFYVFDGSTSVPIGAGKVDRTFFGELNTQWQTRVRAAADPLAKLVWWAYPDAAGDGTCDSVLIYHWPSQRWAKASIATEVIFSSLTLGYTLEELDAINASLDALSPTLDSRVWTGGKRLLAAFGTTHRLSYFTGSNLAATIETGEFEAAPGQRALLTELRPLVDGGTITAALATRNIQTETATFGSAVAINANGFVPFRASGRYHRARVSVAAAGTWTHAIGLSDVVAEPQGGR